MKKGEKISEKELKHHSRRLSIKEGIFWTIRQSFGANYVVPFSVAIGASNSIIAIINSLWHIASVTQIFGGNLVKKTKRKTILNKTLLSESFSWLFLAIIGILYLKGIATHLLPYLIILDFALIMATSGMGHPAWFSLIGDLVDPKFRGRWFSKRNTILSFTTVILTIGAALILEQFTNHSKETIGFILFFTLAFLARIYCKIIMNKHYDQEKKKKKEKKYNIKLFLKEITTSNFGKFVLFRTMFSFAVGLSAPLVAIYLLKELQYDYFTYILIILSGTIFSIITLNLWGKIADRFGNYKVIALTTILIPLTPIWWILSMIMIGSDFTWLTPTILKIYLFIIPGLIGGSSWSAFLMASGNFIYDNISKERRAKAISYLNLFMGLGAMTGGFISAALLGIIKPIIVKDFIISTLFIIFSIGFILRAIMVSFWVPKLKEKMKMKKFKGLTEMKKIILKDSKSTFSEDIHEISSIPGYITEK